MMKDILTTILREKEKEVWRRKKEIPYRTLERSPLFSAARRSLREALATHRPPAVIAEFKRSSPSRGMIHEGARAAAIVPAYEAAGAAAVSVLTDTPFFGGHDDDLREARDHTSLPLLRKDFLLDEYQVVEARALGADAILLIAAALEKKQLHTLTRLALSLELDVLFEIHNPLELVKMPDEEVIVGVNNRDLTTFSVGIERSLEAAAVIPAGLVRVSESGLDDPHTVARLHQAGYHGFLIGEAFMRESDPGEACSTFLRQCEKVIHEPQKET